MNVVFHCENLKRKEMSVTMTSTKFLMLLICVSFCLTVPSLASQHDKVVTYWKSFYPSIQIPSIVSQHISQMSDENIDDVTSLIHKNTLSSALPFFCETADLVCHMDEKSMTDRYAGYIKYRRSTNSPIIKKVPKIPPGTFFRESVLKNGEKIFMGDLKQFITPAKAFLPNAIASLLPLEKSQTLFQRTNFGELVSITMDMCNAHVAEEKMKCVTSVEELLEFPVKVFNDKRVKLMSSKSTSGSRSLVLLDNVHPLLQENRNAAVITCHEVFYPYMVMYCHSTSGVQMYEANLVHPETLEKINDEMVAVCHRNTTYWDPHHVAFSALKTRPGESEVCHWMSTANLAWIHLDDML